MTIYPVLCYDTNMKIHLYDKDFDLKYNFEDYPHMHTHSYWEFFLVTEGTYLHRLNSSSTFLMKNTIQLIRPSDAHSLHSLSHRMGHINLVISKDIMKKQLDLLSPGAYEELISSKDDLHFNVSDSACKSYVQKALSAEQFREDDPQHRYWISQLFLSFVKDLLYQRFMKQKSQETSYLPEFLQQIISLLNDREKFVLPINEIIKDSSYSYVHISRSFKQYMKISLSDYYLAVKMNYARRLLEEGHSVLTTSEKVGYSTQSHFNIAFKKFYNTTPIKYKKEWAKFYDGLEEDKRE